MSQASPRDIADVEHIEVALLAVLDGAAPGAEDRDAAAASAERLAGVLAAGGHPATGERARALALALRDGRELGERLAPLADGIAEIRRALEVLRPAGGDHAAGTPADRRRPTSSLLVVTGDAAGAVDLVDAAAVRGARADVASPAEAHGLLASRAPDVLVLLGGAAAGPEADALARAALEAGVDVVAAAGADHGEPPAGAAQVSPTLPAEELAATALAFRDEDPARGARVMVVSADPGLQAGVAAALQASGGTAELRDLHGARRELRVAPPDLLLLDARAAEPGALAWCRGLRLTPMTAALPVVLLLKPGASLEPALRAGADDVLHDPVAAQTLEACIVNRLARARAQRRHGDADPLTGLPRDVVGQRRLGRLVETCAQAGEALSVALVGVDSLDAVNAAHGRAAGTSVVVAAARLLRSVVREEDLLARWSGGEFLLAARGVSAETAVQRLEEALGQARRLTPAGSPDGTTLRLSAGVAGFPDAGTTGPALADRAADAMVSARRAGGDRIVLATGTEASRACDVLLVEDSTVSAALVQHALGGLGLRVEHLEDGAEAALRLADPEAPMPRVVLLDWELPGMDGPGVLRRMAAAGTLSRTRVVMLTGRSGEDEVLAAMRAGASDHVAKPFSIAVLVERVRRALAG